MSQRQSDQIDPESREAVAGRLRALRDVLGLNQTQMGAACSAGAGNTTWLNYEKGYRGFPIKHALPLCHRFNVTLDWIYRGHAHTLPPGLAEKIRTKE